MVFEGALRLKMTSLAVLVLNSNPTSVFSASWPLEMEIFEEQRHAERRGDAERREDDDVTQDGHRVLDMRQLLQKANRTQVLTRQARV